MDYNIYCVSNASSDTDDKNTLNSFTNLFPQSLDLKNREWEIGVVSIGLHYNYNQLTLSKGQPCFIALKNELTSINSSEEDIKSEILDQTKSIWVLPNLDEDVLTVHRLMQNLMQYIYKEGMRLYHFEPKSGGKDEKAYVIDENPKKEMENENYNYNRYFLIHKHLIKILNLKYYQNGFVSSQAKSIKFFDNEYVYFSVKKNFALLTTAIKAYSVLKPGLVQIKSNIISDVPSGNSYSTIMFTTTLPNQMEGHYFYHNVKNIRYYQVRQSNIETINTQFTDSFGNLLSLNEGQPSIVHFHLKEKDKNMDYELTHVRIDSQVDTKLNYENTNSSFWAHLKHPISLNQNAKIALMDISFPNTICSIPKSIGRNPFILNVLMTQNETKRHVVEIPELYFCNSDDLTTSMNRLLSEELKEILHFENFNGFFRIVAKTNKPFSIGIPKNFCPFLGMYDYSEKELARIEERGDYVTLAVTKERFFEAPKPMDVYKLYPGVMICYANFVQHSIIGDKFYPIFRVIPTIGQSTQNDYCSIHFEHLEFIRCNVDYLDDIKIELRRLDGNLIEFNDDRRVILNIVIKNPI